MTGDRLIEILQYVRLF